MTVAGEARPELRVAAGVLQCADSRVLVSQRPAGKPHAGAWEFPGGKIATGETPLQGLARELREELGVEVRVARHLARYRHDYPDKTVHLHIWLVPAWAGEPTGLESQSLQWLQPAELLAHGLLPADKPVVDLLLGRNAVTTAPLEAALRDDRWWSGAG